MSHGLLKVAEEGNRKERHPDIHGCGELRPYATHALPRGAFALAGFALQDDNVLAVRAGELIRDAGAYDAPTDDHYVCR
jgi:hypothetical protein